MSSHTSGRVWRIDLPQTRPLSLNGREHWRIKAKRVKELRDTACLLVKAAGVPKLQRIRVELHYAPRDKRRRDPLNLVATLKPIEDGIVDAGIVPDDTPEFVTPTMPVIDAPTGKQTGLLYVLIREDTQ